MDAGEIMGMSSSAKEKSPNAPMWYLSCKVRAQKKRTVAYLDNMSDERRRSVVKKAITIGRKHRKKRKEKQKELVLEMARRQAKKDSERDTKKRKELEKKTSQNLHSVDDMLESEFPNLSAEKKDIIGEIMGKSVVGRRISHVWFEDNTLVTYNGKIEKFVRKSVGSTGSRTGKRVRMMPMPKTMTFPSISHCGSSYDDLLISVSQ